jgi:SAM-dependent methyltransferase
MSSKIGTRVCPVCKSGTSELIFEQRFSNLSSGGLLDSYDVVACRVCGFCYADNIPSQEVFNEYYREMSKYEQTLSNGVSSYFYLGKFNSIVKFIKHFIPDTNKRILEIGCSTGTLLNLLKNLGYSNLIGVDPSPACAVIADQLYAIKVLTGTLSNLPIEAGPIDLVILAGTLEHIKDLDTALDQISNILAPDGMVCVSVPDASHYMDGEDAPYQEFSVEHINFFGPVSLANLLKKRGFAEISMTRDVIEVNYHTTTPVFHSLFEKEKTINPVSFSLDNETRAGLIQYVDKSRIIDEQIHKVIKQLVERHQPIIVWGTGAHTLRLLLSSPLGEAEIIAFVDSNPKYQGKSLNNIQIISPEALKTLPQPILISSRAYENEIADQIRNTLRLDNEIITLY